MHDQNPQSKPKSMHESKPIVGSTTVEQRRSNNVFLPRVGSATVVSSEAHCRSEWVLGVRVSCTSERVFWSILECFFYLFDVRVMENIEVGYGALTVRITGRQSVKIQTTDGYIELETNHRWVMCNYLFYIYWLFPVSNKQNLSLYDRVLKNYKQE